MATFYISTSRSQRLNEWKLEQDSRCDEGWHEVVRCVNILNLHQIISSLKECGCNKIQAIASEGLKLEHGLTTTIKGILTCLVSYKPSVDVAVCSGLRSSDDQITCANVPMFRWSDTISSWAEQISGPWATHQHKTDKIEIHHLTHFR